MDRLKKLFLVVIFIGAAAIHGACGEATVTGTVFCDQCKDGEISLFDYPLSGVKVTMTCRDSDGQPTVLRQETTNWLGSYSMKFDGTPNLSGCYAQVSGNGRGSTGCGAVAGPARSVTLMLDMFDMEMYSVDPLLAQPMEPMSFCLRSAYRPVPVAPANPPPVTLPRVPKLPPMPRWPRLPHVPRLPRLPHIPALPRLPHLPPLPRLPPSYLEASVCPHRKWMMPEYRCYWKVVTPDTPVASAFGLIAAGRYGPNMTLWRGMNGRGDPYRTLLREGTTALLNSYNTIHFPYNPLGVIHHMNWALKGPTRQVLHTALSFMRANLGTSFNATCRFTPCK